MPEVLFGLMVKKSGLKEGVAASNQLICDSMRGLYFYERDSDLLNSGALEEEVVAAVVSVMDPEIPALELEAPVVDDEVQVEDVAVEGEEEARLQA